MDEKKLWKYIKRNSKSSYQALVNNNKPDNIIANKGLKEGEIAIRHGGEYNGFAIRALENIKPVLTNLRIAKAIKLLSKGNIQGAITVLRIIEETRIEGIGLLYGLLKIWLHKNEIPIPNEYIKKAINIKSRKIIEWIDSNVYSP